MSAAVASPYHPARVIACRPADVLHVPRRAPRHERGADDL